MSFTGSESAVGEDAGAAAAAAAGEPEDVWIPWTTGSLPRVRLHVLGRHARAQSLAFLASLAGVYWWRRELGLWELGVASAVSFLVHGLAHWVGSIGVVVGQRQSVGALRLALRLGLVGSGMDVAAQTLLRHQERAEVAGPELLRKHGGRRVRLHGVGLTFDVDVAVFAPRTGLPPTACVIYLPGNGEHWEFGSEQVRFTHRNMTLVGFNYPGVGRSSGRATLGTMTLASAAVVEFVKRDLGFAAHQIVLFGHSIGGGMALQIAPYYPGVHVVHDRSFSRTSDVVGTIAEYLVCGPARPVPSGSSSAAAASSGGGGGGSAATRPWLRGAVATLAYLVMNFGIGWEIDSMRGLRKMLQAEDERGRASAGAGMGTSDSLSSSSSSSLSLGEGRRLVLTVPNDRVILHRSRLSTALLEAGPSVVRRVTMMELSPYGVDSHNRALMEDEFERTVLWIHESVRLGAAAAAAAGAGPALR